MSWFVKQIQIVSFVASFQEVILTLATRVSSARAVPDTYVDVNDVRTVRTAPASRTIPVRTRPVRSDARSGGTLVRW